MDGNELESTDRGVDSQRAGRPRGLSVEEIVTASIDLVDERGLDGLSMPKLAKRLGVGTMTLYTYVANKEELLDRIAERIFEGLSVPAEGPWQATMFEFFDGFRSAVIAHPSLAQLLATGRITIPKVFDILENVLGQMSDGGLEVEEAFRVFYAALAYTVGFVLWEIPRAHHQSESDYADQWAALLGGLDTERYPLLTGPVVDVASTVASAAQFEWGLRRLLSG